MTTPLRRKLRHPLASLLLLAPALLLAGCNGPQYSCEPGGQEDRRVTVPPRFQFADGSLVGPDTTCQQLCSALSSYTEGDPCGVESRDSASVPTEVSCRLPELLCAASRIE